MHLGGGDCNRMYFFVYGLMGQKLVGVGGGGLYKRLVAVYPRSNPNERHCPYDSHHKVS